MKRRGVVGKGRTLHATVGRRHRPKPGRARRLRIWPIVLQLGAIGGAIAAVTWWRRRLERLATQGSP